MGKNLIIVESPAKAKTINKILGKDFVVKASMGHVRDLPEKQLGVDVDEGFAPKYVKIKGREKVVTELKKAAATADAIYLAPDPDREGEAIAWHLLELLKSKKVPEDKFFRVTYNEITAPAIREAFNNPTRIDSNRVDSQQARRILDRIVGYRVSPLLWRRIRGSSSAGRVQSVALRLVCEREAEIQNFNPEEYWLMGAKVRKLVDPLDPFEIRLSRVNGEKPDIGSTEAAEELERKLADRKLVVKKITRKEVKRRPRAPLITSSLQQAASSAFGYSPSNTMRIAQKLYEGVDFGDGPVGVITYMRTDSVNVSKEAQDTARTLIGSTFGAEYVPEKPNVYKSRGSAQEAHEAIRPTDATRTPDQLAKLLEPNELKVYTLIWERFIASQMTPARIAQLGIDIEAEPADGDDSTYQFRASASEVVFPGYMKVTGAEKEKKTEEEAQADKLPPLQENEALECLEWLKEQKFTQPPPRFSEASLVRAMEENGVGRPSTYAQILSTLINRKYVDREKRQLVPTELGTKVNKFLVDHLEALFDVGFTAGMEESLDKIEDGSVEWTSMLGDFYKQFLVWLEVAKGPDADPDLVGRLLDVADGVKEWDPPVKRGRRTYSDEKYVKQLREQLDKGEKAISDRQLVALKKLVCRYRDQVGGLDDRIDDLQIAEELAEAKKPKEPPRELTMDKMKILDGITYNPARKIGKRVYDDHAFFTSLKEQVQGGKRLSENQVRYLDKLLIKYQEQIENFEELSENWDLDAADREAAVQAGAILGLMEGVADWKPPVQRGKKEWDDHGFYDSLRKQFDERKSLSPRQLSALKRMARNYAGQINDYEAKREELGLLAPKKAKAEKAEEDSE